MTTWSLSPAFIMLRDQPRRARPFGLPPSMDHSTSLPVLGSLAMTCTQMCGLVHCSSLSVPSSVTSFLWSNIAKESCAEAVAANTVTTAAAEKIAVFIGSLSYLKQEYI